MTFTALSIIQPWPYMILRPDVTDPAVRADLLETGRIKDCENRDWETPVRGWVLIHSSSSRLAQWKYTAAELFGAKLGVEVPLRDNLVYGAVIGAARVDECRWGYRSKWYTGPRAIVFGASVPFASPVFCEGRPRFFQLPLDERSAANGKKWTNEQCAAYADRAASKRRDLVHAIASAGLAKAFGIAAEQISTPAPAIAAATDSSFLL